MAPPRKKNKFDSQLPPTPCTLEMRQNIQRIAASEDKSVAEVQRSAYALFLREYVSKTNNAVSYAN